MKIFKFIATIMFAICSMLYFGSIAYTLTYVDQAESIIKQKDEEINQLHKKIEQYREMVIKCNEQK